MHLSVRTSHALEEGEAPVNPEQTPADMLVLSFTDSDLACMAAAHGRAGGSLRLTTLARLKHPLSVDLYVEQVAAGARVILARLLGGYEWWSYGAEELARLARKKNIALILLSGDGRADMRLAALSTVSPELLAALDGCMAEGGAENAARVLAALRALADGEVPAVPVPDKIPAGALYRAIPHGGMGTALLIFYRAHFLAADMAPVDALLEALAARGMAGRAFMVSSMKDAAALAELREQAQAHAPDIILDCTAFSAAAEGEHPLAACGVPILQCAFSGTSHEAWEQSRRGMGAADMAMHVVLPEADGRIFTRAVSFKAAAQTDAALEFTRMAHAPEAGRVAFVAELAAAWVRLAKTPASARRVALVVSDYPGRAGRCAYAVGLDAPASALHMLRLLAEAGYAVSGAPDTGEMLMAVLETRSGAYPMGVYRKRFAAMPEAAQQAITSAWGAPEADAFFRDDAFHIPVAQFGHAVVAKQPDRGSALDRKAGYHDAAMPPRHGYLAFYWWLRDVAQMDAMVHLGTHGNLEWLPGKSVALSAECWPEIVLGPVPVAYPYIVSDPGEAAQAKRRISAVTLGHLTPPLAAVELSPELAELETLVDEFGSADGLDARRMRYLREEIVHRARRSGLPGDSDDALMATLETHLCDIKEQRVRDGLHVYGQHAPGEAEGLLAALSGRFIAPGPGGSPARGRMDVLPTGRNLVAIDPRTIPTRTAFAIGRRAADEFVRRYVQDHGDWPKNVMIDVWGSATLRNGGDEIAQALYLMGVCPLWDKTSARVSGFEVVPDAQLPWPRVDVTLRISGLFRDMFPQLIALFDDAVKAVRGAEAWRIFGNAPEAYGAGVTERIDAGRWSHRDELGQAYMAASSFGYRRGAEGAHVPEALKERIAGADAFIHVQDQRETDVLDGADFADAEGGFAAAAGALGASPTLYHMDSSNPDALCVRTLAEEISLALHSRALSKAWIGGQMRHFYAGAAALADVVDQLFAFAATTDAVVSAQFDAVFDAYVLDETVREFMAEHNPAALGAIAERLDEAVQRGFWRPLRNSALPLLDVLRGAKEAA